MHLWGPDIYLNAGLIKPKVLEWGRAEVKARAASKAAAAAAAGNQ
jgi:hypothetical protein